MVLREIAASNGKDRQQTFPTIMANQRPEAGRKSFICHCAPLRLSRCTACRAIKVRCDNPNLAYDGPCSRCTRLSLECVYHEKKRGRKPKNEYVESHMAFVLLMGFISPDEKQQSCIVPAKAPRTSSTQLVADSPEFSSALESRAPRPPHGSPLSHVVIMANWF